MREKSNGRLALELACQIDIAMGEGEPNPAVVDALRERVAASRHDHRLIGAMAKCWRRHWTLGNEETTERFLRRVDKELEAVKRCLAGETEADLSAVRRWCLDLHQELLTR